VGFLVVLRGEQDNNPAEKAGRGERQNSGSKTKQGEGKVLSKGNQGGQPPYWSEVGTGGEGEGNWGRLDLGLGPTNRRTEKRVKNDGTF